MKLPPGALLFIQIAGVPPEFSEALNAKAEHV